MDEKNLNEIRTRYLAVRQELADAQRYRKPETTTDYEFDTPDGTVKLSQLFNGKSDLFMIHNMGVSCSYCTLWADGFNGVLTHLTDRASVVISSPDAVAVQQQFKQDRSWHFEMVSNANNTFAVDMGYQNENGLHPGVSVFSNKDGNLRRVADTPFGPGDDFCAVWHLLDLLPDGANGWQPKFGY